MKIGDLVVLKKQFRVYLDEKPEVFRIIGIKEKLEGPTNVKLMLVPEDNFIYSAYMHQLRLAQPEELI